MTVLSLRPNQTILPRHASTEEYATFVTHHLENPQSVKFVLEIQAKFVKHHPDLSEWLQLPLLERIGRAYKEDRRFMTNLLAYRARGYLYFLVLRGYLHLDWEWLIAIPRLRIWGLAAAEGVQLEFEQLEAQAKQYGYQSPFALVGIRHVLGRIVLHTGKKRLAEITDQDCLALKEALYQFKRRPDLADFFGTPERYDNYVRQMVSDLHYLQVLLYHRGQLVLEPDKVRQLPSVPPRLPPAMESVVSKYLGVRKLTDMPKTVSHLNIRLRRFATWMTEKYPGIDTFATVTRDHVLEFAEALKHPLANRKQPFGLLTRRGYLSALNSFFRDIVNWGWSDVPPRPLLGVGDLPKPPYRVPRFIPEDQLDRLMPCVRDLECPFQRAALLIARWTGARRGEIQRLELNCLDQYPDGTPRLRIPAGKTKKERLVPINKEAAEAIRILQARPHPPRGFRDSHTGVITHYLFIDYGRRISTFYLFTTPLRKVCQRAGLLTPDGKPAITAHQFRHTVGTQLAERGAKLHTIMKILGHHSASMSMVYAQISDREVLKDYQTVLSPGATLAGPCAEVLRNGEMPLSSIDWLKTNFFKTELELGHCLRLPEEGPCECDLYLTCAKFVTTPEYAPRLRHRRRQEITLAEDATQRGWEKEVERHRRTACRIERLLADLGEPVEEPDTGG